jgi:hypothetical protein
VTLKHSDVDLEFIATKASGSAIGWPTNPERQLIRYQFLEIFVRLALAKFFKCNIKFSFEVSNRKPKHYLRACNHI